MWAVRQQVERVSRQLCRLWALLIELYMKYQHGSAAVPRLKCLLAAAVLLVLTLHNLHAKLCAMRCSTSVDDYR